MKQILLILSFVIILSSCSEQGPSLRQRTDDIASEYVMLVLSAGKYDPDYVDAYFGPDSLKQEAENRNMTANEIITSAQKLDSAAEQLDFSNENELTKKRGNYLKRMIKSMITRVEMRSGKKFSFDEEAKQLYDVVSPKLSPDHYDIILAKLDSRLPGEGPIQERFVLYRSRFIIPADSLRKVFNRAVEECRRRTIENIELGYEESFTVEYVKDVSWGAYNWFKGNGHSLIQVNTGMPIYIDRAIDLAAHEGYPGHHVYHSMLEQRFVRDSGWVEFSVYPLFSPQATISEGLANAGIEVMFPRAERMKFEQEVLFPMAGIDPELAEEYYEIMDMIAGLDLAGNDAARDYLDGKATKEETIERVMKYKLRTREHAVTNLKFYEQYGAYVVNYNIGQTLIETYLKRKCGSEIDRAKIWSEYYKLLSEPLLPSDLLK